jgi:prophage regulatory protein
MRMSSSPIPNGLLRQAGGATTLPSEERTSARLIRFAEVKHRVGLSRSTVWRLEKANQFPKSIRISSGRRAWLESAIDDWISSKASSIADGMTIGAEDLS